MTIKIDEKTGKLRLSEADVTRQVRDFLESEGWRGVRMNVGGTTHRVLTNRTGWDRGGEVVDRYVAFGEPGMPDWLFWKRRFSEDSVRLLTGPGRTPASFYRAQAWLLFIEFKAPGRKPKPHQLEWHEAARARGALVKVVDHFETFRDWYRGVFS